MTWRANIGPVTDGLLKGIDRAPRQHVFGLPDARCKAEIAAARIDNSLATDAAQAEV
jgi:hypothetical protein